MRAAAPALRTAQRAGAAAQPVGALGVDRGGFTLIELLMVMVLLGLALGAGVGILSGVDVESGGTAERVRAVLLAAQSAAQDTGLPSGISLAPDRRALILRLPQPRLSWHFEHTGERLALFGSSLQPDGFLGGGLRLHGSALDAHAELDLSGRGDLDSARGMAIDLRLRYQGPEGGEILASGEDFFLRLSSEGELVAQIAVMDRVDPAARKAAGRLELRSQAAVLTAGRWQRLQVIADGRRFQMVLDGRLLDHEAIDAPLLMPVKTLRLGGRPRPFPGDLDELSLFAYEAREPMPLPRNVDWPVDAPSEFDYLADGTLVGASERPLELRLEMPGGQEHRLLLSARGVLDG